MSKFRQGSHKLKDGQKIYFGDNNKGSAYYDSGTSTLVITTTSGNINLSPGGTGNVVLDGQSFPNTAGEVGEGLTTDGAGTLSWEEGSGEATPVGDVGVFGGGDNDGTDTNVIQFITISSAGNATNFGDLTAAREQTAATSNGYTGRGVFAGGYTGSKSNIIDYITITTSSNATNFGDIISPTNQWEGTSNGTNDRGVFMGGASNVSAQTNAIDYITISSTGNSSNFGDLTQARRGNSACSNGTNDRGVCAGGYTGSAFVNIIDYITISSTSDATNFGDLTLTTPFYDSCGTSNGTNDRGLFCGGSSSNVIEYITISSPGNSTDFGDLVTTNHGSGATSNTTNNRGVIAGGAAGTDSNVIQYITIPTLGNSADFGDLLDGVGHTDATSNA